MLRRGRSRDICKEILGVVSGNLWLYAWVASSRPTDLAMADHADIVWGETKWEITLA